MPKFSKTSEARLDTCHPDLIRVMKEAIKYYDFTVLCGFRNQTDQDEAYRRGASKLRWPHGKHNQVPSRAIDIAPYPVDWHNVQRFHDMKTIVLLEADKLGIKLTWGGDWKMRDLPHFELT